MLSVTKDTVSGTTESVHITMQVTKFNHKVSYIRYQLSLFIISLRGGVWLQGGGAKLFSRNLKRGGAIFFAYFNRGQNFLQHVKGGPEKIDDPWSHTGCPLPLKNDSSLKRNCFAIHTWDDTISNSCTLCITIYFYMQVCPLPSTSYTGERFYVSSKCQSKLICPIHWS